MSRKRRKNRAATVPVAWYAPQRVVADDFVCGALTAGMLAALQDTAQGRPALSRRTLRLALQGGAALAAGTAALHSWRSGQHGRALLAVGAGCAAIAFGEAALADAPAAPEPF
ncbi:MAG: hypothetical protein IJR28_05900 [Ottowia sp.]|nr:hypothetical protein [Ottowia sp.]